MRILLLLIILFASNLYAHQYPVKLGDKTVIILQERYGKGKAFVHLHQNETTALKAARAVIRSQGGSLLTLVHDGHRTITFRLKHQRYEFDPNRIFTDKGIRQTLNTYGDYSPAAHRVVKQFATKIKQLLPPGKIIAVHNNESYSLLDYLPGHALSHDVRSLAVNQRHALRNFYVVTRTSAHRRLRQSQFNSVLQSPHATNDGSLSIFLAHRDYVNVEAGYDQLAAQITMLRYVSRPK